MRTHLRHADVPMWPSASLLTAETGHPCVTLRAGLTTKKQASILIQGHPTAVIKLHRETQISRYLPWYPQKQNILINLDNCVKLL